MARQNRVTPMGELIATPHRGCVYGNRGCLHDSEGRIRRAYNGKRWIACRLRFRGVASSAADAAGPLHVVAVLRSHWRPLVPLLDSSAYA